MDDPRVVPLRGGGQVHVPFWVDWSGLPCDVRTVFDIEYGRLTCIEVRLTRREGDASLEVVWAPLRRLLRAAVDVARAYTTSWGPADEAGVTPLTRELLPRERGRRQRLDPPFLLRVAEEYRQASAESGRGAARAVAEALDPDYARRVGGLMKAGPYTLAEAQRLATKRAQRWIAEAREQGYLGTATPGRQGEATTPTRRRQTSRGDTP